MGQTRGHTIWLVNLFFGAGPAPTGALLESVAARLQERGYYCEVLTGHSNYSTGGDGQVRYFSGRIHRLYSGPRRAQGFYGRFLVWVAFYLSTAWFAFTRPLPAQVLVLTTPPFLHLVFVLRNLLTRKRATVILWNQDIYPEILAAVGILHSPSWLYQFLLAVECYATARVTQTVVLDHAMEAILRRHGARKTHVVPNWEVNCSGESGAKDTLELVIQKARSEFRYLVLYTGNYGWGHDLSALWAWLRRNPDQRDFFFLFVGGGEKWQEVTGIRRDDGIVAVAAFPYVGKARLTELIKEADFGLVALERACVGLMSPSKIHGYLATGKPLLYLGPDGSNVAEAIANYACGFRVDEQDPAALTECLRAVLNERFDYASQARNAARASACRYTEAVGVADVIRVIEGGRTGSRLPGKLGRAPEPPTNRTLSIGPLVAPKSVAPAK